MKKNKWFYYKLISALIILCSLLGVYSYHMITKTWLRNVNVVEFPFQYGLFQWQFISFFTYQSNFIVGMWFLISAIYHGKKEKLINKQNVRIAITCYISVTMIVWTFFLLPGMFFTESNFAVGSFIQGIFFHIVYPILMIIYTMKHIEPLSKTIKRYYLSSFWIYWIYPICYSLFVLVGYTILVSVEHQDIPLTIAFPYAPFFFSQHNDIISRTFDIFILLMIMVFLIVIIQIFFVLVNILYVSIINRKSKKKIRQQAMVEVVS